MANTTGQVSTFSDSAIIRDVSSVFSKISLNATPILNEMQSGIVAYSTKHEWFDSPRTITGTTLKTNYDQSEASGVLILTSNEGFKVGTILNISGQIKRVSVVDAGGENVTTVHIGGSADADVSAGADVDIVATANVEGITTATSLYQPKINRYNYTQILAEEPSVTDTEQFVRKYVGLQDILTDEVMNKMELMRLELGRMAINGVRVQAASNSEVRIAGGLEYFVANEGGYAPSAAAFSVDNLDAFLLYMHKTRGAMPSKLYMSPLCRKTYFGDLNNSYIQTARTDNTAGNVIDYYVSQHGYKVQLITDMNITNDKVIYFGDMAKQGYLVPLDRDAMRLIYQPKQGRSNKVMLTGQYTFQFQNVSTMGKFTIS